MTLFEHSNDSITKSERNDYIGFRILSCANQPCIVKKSQFLPCKLVTGQFSLEVK